MSSDRRRSLKRRLNRAGETRLVNPVVRALLTRGRLGGKLDAMLMRAVATDLTTIRIDLGR
jgi:hypothetical protein